MNISTKVCTKCNREKSSIDFSWKNKGKGRKQSHCKSCQNQSTRKHYNENILYYKEKAARNRAKSAKVAYRYVYDYLLTHPCVDCGESDPIVLDFDHKNNSKKYKEVSVLAIHGYSVKLISCEIAKCDVRCANCHRRRHALENGFWKTRY